MEGLLRKQKPICIKNGAKKIKFAETPVEQKIMSFMAQISLIGLVFGNIFNHKRILKFNKL